MRRLLGRLPGGQFTRSVAVLAGGTAFGQAIAIAASPILTRLYTPEDFGTLGVFAALLGMITVLASMRYELAIPLPKEDSDSVAIVAACLLIIPLVAIVLSALIWYCTDDVTRFTGATQLQSYLWFMPIGVIFVGVYAVFDSWAIRKRAYRKIAQTRITQSIAAIGSQLLLFPLGATGLLIGTMLGQAAGCTALGRYFAKTRARQTRIDINVIGHFTCRYRRFPLLSGPSAFLNTAAEQLPVLVLAAFHGPVAAGLFALATRAVKTPLGVVSQSSAQVFFAEGALVKTSRRDFIALFRTVSRQQACIGLPLLLLVPIAAPLFEILFGSDWREAGVFVAVLAPALYAQFVASPSGASLDILERQDLHLARETMRLFLAAVAGGAAFYFTLSPRETVAAFAVALFVQSIAYAATSWYAIHAAARLNSSPDRLFETCADLQAEQ